MDTRRAPGQKSNRHGNCKILSGNGGAMAIAYAQAAKKTPFSLGAYALLWPDSDLLKKTCVMTPGEYETIDFQPVSSSVSPPAQIGDVENLDDRKQYSIK